MDEETKLEDVEEKAAEETADETEETAELKDKHGQDAISRGKYEREIKERDAKIAELEGKIAEAAKTEESARSLKEEIRQLRDDMKAKDIEHELTLCGCKSVKAAVALLPDYDGDISKLAEECPFLFAKDEKPNGSTGVKPNGSAKDLDWIDKAFEKKR